MKYLFKSMLLVFAASLFMGCPYSADVPIDNPSVKIDEKMLGPWEAKSSSDYVYNVTKQDNFTYRIEKKNAASPDDVTVYTGHLSDIDGTRFLNITEEGASTKTWYFYKVEMTSSGSKLTLSPVTENIDEKFSTSADLKDFFKKYMKLSFFYSKDDEVYIKAD